MIKPPWPAVGQSGHTKMTAVEWTVARWRPTPGCCRHGSQVLIKCAGESPACILWEQNVLC